MNAPIAIACQRWRKGRESYRPAGEPIDTSKYGVEVIDEATQAKPFVEAHHYEHTFPAARESVGLFRGRELVGVAVFSVPVNPKQPAKYTTTKDGCDLGRLVLLDDVPANGESWFLARAFKALLAEKRSIGAVVSYSDPIARTTAEGVTVMPGHVGTIYQAFNARYVGLSKRERAWVHVATRRNVSRRALAKIKKDDQGAAYAYAQLLAMGAPARRAFEDGAAYVARALREGPFETFIHPGKHTYAWTLRRDVEHKIEAKPFPKKAAV